MLLRSDFTHNLRVRKQAESLVKAGWRVTVIALALNGQPVGRSRDHGGFDVWRVCDRLSERRAAAENDQPHRAAMPARSQKRRRAAPVRALRFVLNRLFVMVRMMRVIRECRPDVVEAHNVNVLTAAFIGARLVGAALVYDAHEINTEREGYYARLRRMIYLIERITLPRAALIMSTTDMRAEHYLDLYKLREKPLVIQNKPPFAEPARSARLHEALAIPHDRIIVLYQGGLQEGRGLHNIVRVAAKVRDAAFVFLGNGSQKASLQSLARNLGVDDNVYFHPAVSLGELPSYTASADIGMQVLRNTCLNHYTTDSNKIFEYGMAGLAVVASNFPEIRRIIQQYRYGMLVEPNDVDAIAGAVQRLVDDNLRRRELQRNAVDSRYALSWESQENVFLDAMERVVANTYGAAT